MAIFHVFTIPFKHMRQMIMSVLLLSSFKTDGHINATNPEGPFAFRRDCPYRVKQL